MGRFADYRNWEGSWVGSYDGRPASLTSSSSLTLDPHRAQLSLDYHENGNLWVSALDGDFDAFAHDVRDRHLDPLGGAPARGRLEWPRLLIHTWDTDFISGSSRWDGKEYGLWFARVPATPGPRPALAIGRRFTTWYNLDGGGDHPHNTGISWPTRGVYDGRPASLGIGVDPEGPTPSQDANLRFVFDDFAGHRWHGWKTVRPWDHWVEDLELTPERPSDGPLRWPRFHLHTWNTRQASGWSEWDGQQYGFAFRNAT